MANIQQLKKEFRDCCDEVCAAGRPIGEQEQARLLEKAKPLAAAWALSFLGLPRKSDAEDIAQECCLKLLAMIRERKLPDDTLNYFLTMIHHKVMDFFRRANTRPIVHLAGEPDEQDPLERLPGGSEDPGDELDRAEAVGHLSTVMAALSEGRGAPGVGPVATIYQGLGELCRRLLPEIFERHFTEQEDLKTVAKALSLSHDALRQQKKRCLGRLRDLFVEQFGEPAI